MRLLLRPWIERNQLVATLTATPSDACAALSGDSAAQRGAIADGCYTPCLWSRCRYHPPSRPQARCIAAVSNSPALGSGVATQGSPRVRSHGSEGRDQLSLYPRPKQKPHSAILLGSASVDFAPPAERLGRAARPPQILVVDLNATPDGKKRRDRTVYGNAIVLLRCDTEAAGGFIDRSSSSCYEKVRRRG